MSGWLMLAALASAGPIAPASRPVQAVRLSWDAGTRACVAEVNTIEVGDFATDAGRAALLRALPDRTSQVQLRGSDGVPYRCVGDLISLLQREGYRGLSLGAGAPPGAR